MPALTPHARAQLFRVARILISGTLTQPALASLIASTAVRYPLVMAIVAAVEAFYHELTKRKEIIVPGSRADQPPSAPGARTPPPM